MNNENIILGVDPGTQLLGFALIDISQSKTSPKLLHIGVLDLHKEENHYIRLALIFNKITNLISSFEPATLAIESPFYQKNAQSMLKLGRAQAAAITAAQLQDLQIFEYAPRKIKLSITGQGDASKEQVANLLHHLLKLSPKALENFPFDATDALAAAICHVNQIKPNISSSLKKSIPAKSWNDFIIKNPNRIKK